MPCYSSPRSTDSRLLARRCSRSRPVLRDSGEITVDALKFFIKNHDSNTNPNSKPRPKSVGVLLRDSAAADQLEQRRIRDKWDASQLTYTVVNLSSVVDTYDVLEFLRDLCASRLVKQLHVVSLCEGYLDEATKEHLLFIGGNPYGGSHSAYKEYFLREMERGLKARAKRNHPAMIEPPMFVDNSSCISRATGETPFYIPPAPAKPCIHAVGTISTKITTISIAPECESQNNPLKVYLEWVDPDAKATKHGVRASLPVVRVNDVLLHMHPDSNSLFLAAIELPVKPVWREHFVISRDPFSGVFHHIGCLKHLGSPRSIPIDRVSELQWLELCSFCCPNRFCATARTSD